MYGNNSYRIKVMDQGFVGYLETKRDGLRRQVKQSLHEQKMNREDPQSVRLVYRGVAYSPVRWLSVDARELP